MGMAVFPEWVQSQKLVTDLAERLGSTLSDASAQAVLELKMDQPSAKRLRELAEKANEGMLSREEFAEYETYAQLRGLVAILQSKARLLPPKEMIDREFVRERACARCEYCRLPDFALGPSDFHVEHVIARKHSGSDDPQNLAWACIFCNLYKGPKSGEL